MAMDTVEKHLMENGRHPSLRRWRGPGARNNSDDEWDDHVRSNGASVPRCPVDRNVGLQRMFENVNAIPPEVVPPGSEDHGGSPAEEQHLPDLATNWEHAELDHHVMEVVQQTQTIVENVQAEADSMQEREGMAAASVPGDSPAGLEMDDDAAGPDDTPLDAVQDLNLTDVLLSCHPLYAGASVTKLAATMLIMTICTMHGVSNKFVDELLCLLHKYILPVPNSLPTNMYHAKVLVEKVGHSYENVHACKNGCVLFQGDAHKDMTECPVCNAKRYKSYGKSQVPVSVLRHFPLIPRLVRWFKSPRIAGLLRWAHTNKTTDGKMHGVHDSPAWRAIDTKFPGFAKGFRNIRMALSADGFNPFSSLLCQWSTWPVFVFIYNLPPWLTTKRFFVIPVLLIPGKHSPNGGNINVYMKPVIDQLRKLWWPGVWADDHSIPPELTRRFRLRGCLMWTINDWPGYGLLSGMAHAGYAGCPPCGPEVTSRYSRELHKCLYTGSRRWLRSRHHPYRRLPYSAAFGNETESRAKPNRPTTTEILERAAQYKIWLEAGNAAGGELDPSRWHGVKRASCFFELPYFKVGLQYVHTSHILLCMIEYMGFHLQGVFVTFGCASTLTPLTNFVQYFLVRHCTDAMHVEKNVCENVVKTILGEKDTIASRRDMEATGVREELWLVKTTDARGKTKVIKPVAPYVLNEAELPVFMSRLAAIQVPTGYCGAVAKHVTAKKLSGMKAHDWHVMMQQLLPLCIRGLLQRGPRTAIMRLSRVFRRICAKVVDPNDMPSLKEDVAVTMSMLEMHMPPSFFDVMSHLVLHLVEELELCGPVHTRWMYSVERMNKVLKGFVNNMARPEACMAKSYVLDEAIGLVAEFMAEEYEPLHRKVWTEDAAAGIIGEVLQGAATTCVMTPHMRDIAHEYMLLNRTSFAPLCRYHSNQHTQTFRMLYLNA